MRGDTEVGAMVAFFFLGAFVGNAIALDHVPSWTEAFVTAAVTLIAAYQGARYAFLFNEDREDKKQRKREVSAGNEAIFNLINTHNKFCAIRSSSITPHRNSPARALEILPMPTGLGSFVPLSTKDLTFLFNSDDRNIVSEIALLDAEIQATLDYILERSKIHQHDVQVKFDAANLAEGASINLDQAETILGPRVYRMIMSTTDEMISSIDSVIESCRILIKKLNQVMNRLYPEHVVISMVIRNDESPKQPAQAGGTEDVLNK